MDIKRIILATVSFVILSMAVAYPWHRVLFHQIYLDMGAFTRAQPLVPFGVLAMVIQGAVIAYLYPYWYSGQKPLVSGIRFSLIIGLMVYTVMVFATVAKFDISPKPKLCRAG